MNIIISNSANIPIYEQIKQQIKSAVFDGDIQEGELLPSIRQLARDLKISVITTTRAYNELEQEGLIVSVPGKGCYVQPQNKDLMREQKLRAIEQNLSEAISAARLIRLPNEEIKRMLDILLEEDTDD